jgi:aldose sugar dehydrogenase
MQFMHVRLVAGRRRLTATGAGTAFETSGEFYIGSQLAAPSFRDFLQTNGPGRLRLAAWHLRSALKVWVMPKPVRAPTFRRSLMQASIALLGATALGIAACGGGGGGGGDAPEGNNPPNTSARATVLGVTLDRPWGLAFLPDGRMLVTQRSGSLVIVRADGSGVDATVSGVPAVVFAGQGGLLDVALDPDFTSGENWVYLAYSEAGAGGSGTALARGRLVGNALQNVAVIWRQSPKVAGEVHYGARIAFRADKSLYLAAGERGLEANNGSARDDGVQNDSNTIGKVVRMNRNGSSASVFSTGHRNPQGATVVPGTNNLWITEHGPQGGDELNRVTEGANYGWPVKSYGCNYGAPEGAACRISADHSGYSEPKTFWVPTSTAPAGLAYYTGAGFPEWQGSLFSGALSGTTLWRLTLSGDDVTAREEIAAVKTLGKRIRDVRQGPDGWLYLLTDDGKIVRVDR